MRKLFAIAFKDTLVRFTSPVEWLFFLILPVVFTLILGGSTGPSADSRITLYIVDQANNDLSSSLFETLVASPSVRPELKPMAEAIADFEAREINSVLIIPFEFNEDSLLNNKAELELRLQPNSTNAMIAQQAVQAVLGRISSAVDIANASVAQAESMEGFTFATTVDRQAYFDDALAAAREMMQDSPTRIKESVGTVTDSIEYDPRANSSAGQLITWVFIPLIGLSAMMAYERQKGTLRRILTTPTSKGLYLSGTILGQVLTALVQMLLLVLFGQFVMHLNWGHSPAALAVILVASALAAAALGTMLGTFVKTEGQANGLSIMFGMVMALMGGCWYPLELFPETVRNVVKILPTTWSMQGLLDIVLRGQGLHAVLPEAGVLCGFALLFFVIGVLRFKYE